VNGHISVVRQLLQHPKCDPAAGDNRAIRVAAYAGHTDVVKLLITDLRVNASADDAMQVDIRIMLCTGQ
jgi:hypothetical protein